MGLLEKYPPGSLDEPGGYVPLKESDKVATGEEEMEIALTYFLPVGQTSLKVSTSPRLPSYLMRTRACP